MHTRGTVIPAGLNLRETPGGAIKDKIAQGDDVTIFGKSPNGHWLHVLHHKTNQRGWVAAAYIKEIKIEIDKDPDLSFADELLSWMYGGGIALAILLIILVAFAIRWFS